MSAKQVEQAVAAFAPAPVEVQVRYLDAGSQLMLRWPEKDAGVVVMLTRGERAVLPPNAVLVFV